MPKADKRSNLYIASSSSKAPFASRRITASFPNFSRTIRTKASSDSKSIAPILSFIQRKPSSRFSSTRLRIASKLPIHIKPFMGIPASPEVKAEGKSNPPPSKSASAVSIPKHKEGYACQASGVNSQTPLQTSASRSS